MPDETTPVAPTETPKPKKQWQKKADPLEGVDSDLRAIIQISAIMNGLRLEAPAKVRQWFHARFCARYEHASKDAPPPTS